MTLRLQI